MTRQNQYRNLMLMVQANGMIDTNNGQKEYIGQYHEPIQIGTRLCELVKSGYLVSNQGKKYKYYTLTQKGIDWKDGEELIIKQYPKIKKTRAESEVKQEAKNLPEPKYTRPQGVPATEYEIMSGNPTEIINTNKGVPQHTIREHIKSILS